MHRPRYLRSAGVVGSLLVAGCSRSETTPDGERQLATSRPPEALPPEGNVEDTVATIAEERGLDDTVNLASEGADATGGDPIDDLLATHATDGTLVFLPQGGYVLETGLTLGADTRLAIVCDDRDGLVAKNVDGELRDAHFAVTGEPLSLRNSSLEQHNVSMNRRPEERHDCDHPRD